MAMTGVLRPVTALLLAVAVLMLGGGLQAVLLPIRAEIEGFSDLHIGLMGSAYYLGQIGGCLMTPAIVARVGHIRAFAAFSAIASVAPLLHPISADPLLWMVLRLVTGITIAGVLLVIESWLAAAADHETRGSVLGAYTLIHLAVLMAGMQMISFGSPSSFELFSVVAVLFSLAAVPIALTTAIAPVPPKRAKMRLGWIFYISPAAWLAAFLSGITNGAFWMLTPVFAKDIGYSSSGIALFLAVGVLAGAITQWPVGSLSDRMGRRSLIAVTGLVAGIGGVGLALAPTDNVVLMFAFIAVFGGANFPIYTLALAHINDLVSKRRAVEVASSLLLIFSIGAVIGPIVSAFAMDMFGPGALFVTTAVAHLAITATMTIRGQLRPRIPMRHREDFVLLPRTTPAVYELDPRADPTAEVPEPEPPEPAPEAASEPPARDPGDSGRIHP
jgi:MFS family permease